MLCDIRRTTASAFLALSPRERSEHFHGPRAAPLVVEGAIEHWELLRLARNYTIFCDRFGHHCLHAYYAGLDAATALAHYGATAEEPLAAPWRPSAYFALRRFVEGVRLGHIGWALIMDDEVSDLCVDALLSDLQTAAPPPPFLRTISLQRLFSIGGVGAGVRFQRHDVGWQALVSGRKLWYLAPPGANVTRDPDCCTIGNDARRECEGAHRPRDDSSPRGTPLSGVRRCLLSPGDVMVVPQGWWHATCNEAPFTVAMGGQGAFYRGDLEHGPAEYAARYGRHPFEAMDLPLPRSEYDRKLDHLFSDDATRCLARSRRRDNTRLAEQPATLYGPTEVIS